LRIAFLNGGFGPGKDGVGDYTAALAARCVDLGHECILVGLNDRHVEACEESERPCEGGAVRVLRLPATLSWSERVRQAMAFCSGFQPEWISLQFVAYGYQDKGIIAGLLPRLRALVGSRRLQVMIHELWSGGGPDSTFKQRVVGWVQRFLVLRLLKELRPEVLQTTLPIHVDLLREAGIHCDLLPLFGSIPRETLDPEGAMALQLRGPEGVAAPLLGGFFGAFYPEWTPHPLFGILQNVAVQLGRPLRLVTAGRLSRYSEALWERLGREFPGIQFIKLGEQPTGALSQYFQLLDFAIPAAPWHLLGKSSAAAAMIDHGLPLIVSPDPNFGFRGELAIAGDQSLIHRCDGELEVKLLAGLPKAAPRSSLAKVSNTFLDALRQPDKTKGAGVGRVRPPGAPVAHD